MTVKELLDRIDKHIRSEQLPQDATVRVFLCNGDGKEFCGEDRGIIGTSLGAAKRPGTSYLKILIRDGED